MRRRQPPDPASRRFLYVEARQRLVDWLERQLIGPAAPSEEGRDEIDMSPLDRYSVGVLHPLLSEERGFDPASGTGVEEGESGDPLREDDSDEAPRDGEPGTSERKAVPVRRRRYVPRRRLAPLCAREFGC